MTGIVPGSSAARNPRVVPAGDAFLVFWTQAAPEGDWTLERFSMGRQAEPTR